MRTYLNAIKNILMPRRAPIGRVSKHAPRQCNVKMRRHPVALTPIGYPGTKRTTAIGGSRASTACLTDMLISTLMRHAELPALRTAVPAVEEAIHLVLEQVHL